MAIDFSVQSLQFRRRNKQGKMTLRYAWDVVSRTDSPARMLIESWGGKPDGYIRTFGTDLMLGNYLSERIVKGSNGAEDTDIDLEMVGAADYKITGPLTNLGRALEADNHEKAKLRLKITGADDKWDNDACLNKIMDSISTFEEEPNHFTCDQLNQAMASRVKATFKKKGSYAEQIIAIDNFMTSAKDDLTDVLGGERVAYPPMDRERIAEVILLADGLREKITFSSTRVEEFKPETVKVIKPINRGAEWGEWA